MKLILFGAPGAGKGTQAAELAKKYHIPHISTGEMFRQAIDRQTPMGIKAASFITKGMLVPDDITIEIVKERLSQSDCKNGFILDGFPRTIPQAKSLEEILQELNMKLDHVIQIFVPTDLVLERLTGRRICKNCGASYHVLYHPSLKDGICDRCGKELTIRKVDHMDSVLVRLDASEKQTKPLLKYYQDQGLLVTIDGKQEINDVFLDILRELGEKE